MAWEAGEAGEAEGDIVNSATPSRVTTRGSGTGLSTIRHLSGHRVALFTMSP